MDSGAFMKMSEFESYVHHEKNMWVRSSLKGTHREHGLCWDCGKFKPDNPDENCEIAQALFRFNILANITTPVYECAIFESKEELKSE